MMKFAKKMLVIVLSLVIGMTVFTGCGNNSNESEAIDKTKTQLYIRNYQGGFGNKWLYSAKARYEELHKNDSYEDGKTGVQILITDVKETPEAANVKSDVYQVYFVEKVFYRSLATAGVLEDLTEQITGANPYETNKTIESKLTAAQQEFYGIVGDDGKAHYYALPHYVAFNGFIYNVSLFEERGYYFVDGHENLNGDMKFAGSYNVDKTKSCGPDGDPGTADDGLPETYEDFWALCEYIYSDNKVPLHWSGKSAQYYMTGLTNTLEANYNGFHDMMLNYTFEGETDDLVKVDASGNVLRNSGGMPQTESKTFTNNGSDGYELYRQAGKLYAVEFIKAIVDNMNRYTKTIKTGAASYDAFSAQDDFIDSTLNSDTSDDIAMLVDGVWFDGETADTMTAMRKIYGDKAVDENSQFGLLPLPKATRDKVGEQSVMINGLNSLCFVKKGLSGKVKDLAADFVQYMHTDAAFQEFTEFTNALKAFDYTVSDTSKLSNFGKSVVEYGKNSVAVYPSEVYNSQYAATTYGLDSSFRYMSRVNNSTLTFPYTAFAADSTLTAEKYFVGMKDYFKDDVWSVL